MLRVQTILLYDAFLVSILNIYKRDKRNKYEIVYKGERRRRRQRCSIVRHNLAIK